MTHELRDGDPGHNDGEPWGTVDLYWIPLGAGGRIVRISGKLFEGASAFRQRRARCDLYHSALVVSLPEGHVVIEQAPIPDVNSARRGVVAEGPVGARWAGRFRIFRYEVRCWQEGVIPDMHDAIGSPLRVVDDPAEARRLLHVVPSIPTPVWGRDELDTGEMWNSNSVTSWVLARSGVPASTIHPPRHGRAPGWNAGLAAAARNLTAYRTDPHRPASEGQPASTHTGRVAPTRSGR